ncbi:MAG: FAD-binding oxidoreductase [Planctomycetaceae bacterium]
MPQIIDYPVADMTITVESGMVVSDLCAVLAENNQHLPVDVPNPGETTIGDAVARDVSGSRRFGYGTFRDYVIGIEAVDGQDRRFKSGGRVVKNVAGYDLCKLLIGSHGTLADITQLTFKVLPRPASSGGVRFHFDDFSDVDAVLERATTSATRPRAVDVMSDGEGCDLIFVFDGLSQEVTWQQRQIAEEVDATPKTMTSEDVEAHLAKASALHVPAEARFIAGLNPSKTMRFLQQVGSRNVIGHAGNGIVVGETGSVHAVRSMAEGLGGWCRENSGSGLSLVDPAGLGKKVKQAFDPSGKLNSHIKV